MAHSKEGTGEEQITLTYVVNSGCDLPDRNAFFFPPFLPFQSRPQSSSLPPSTPVRSTLLQHSGWLRHPSLFFVLLCCFPLFLPFCVLVSLRLFSARPTVSAFLASDPHRLYCLAPSFSWGSHPASASLVCLQSSSSSQVVSITPIGLTLETHYFTLHTKITFLISFFPHWLRPEHKIYLYFVSHLFSAGTVPTKKKTAFTQTSAACGSFLTEQATHNHAFLWYCIAVWMMLLMWQSCL